ncbi:hypothetical protein C0J52_10677 [Blattella germanica]|nr:hypothetical protein C0J52_10677 [Blattella germanica]
MSESDSDQPSDQNFLSMVSCKRFQHIKHYFPIQGHSCLPNYRDFGTIKKLLKCYYGVYVPEGYAVMIKKASRKFLVETVAINGEKIGDVLKVKQYIPAKYLEFYVQQKEKKNLKIFCRTKTKEINKKENTFTVQCTLYTNCRFHINLFYT